VIGLSLRSHKFGEQSQNMFKSIFIVDDDPISILVSETILKKLEFAENYYSFQQPKEALDEFEALSPSVVFLDIVMPGISAWEFLSKCRERKSEERCKVVLLTASLNPEDEEKAKQTPEVVDIVSKPLSKEYIRELQAKIEHG